GIVRIFGDDLGRRLSPLLLGGAEQLDAFAAKAREAGVVLRDDLVRDGAAAAEAVRDLRTELSAEFTRQVAENADAIRDLASAMGSLASGTASFFSAFGRRLGTNIARLTGAPDLSDNLKVVDDQIEDVEDRIARLRLQVAPGVTGFLSRPIFGDFDPE